MNKLAKHLKGFELETVLGPFFKLAEAALDLAVPIVVADIIDNGISAGDTNYIMRKCLLLGLLALIGLAFSVTAQYFCAKAAVGFTGSLRHTLFSHIQGLSFSELDGIGVSTMITRMTSDMNQVQSGLNLALRLLLRSPFIVFGAMIMACRIDASSAKIFGSAIIALLVVVFAIMLGCIPLYRRSQSRLDDLLLSTRENLVGARVLRAFCREEDETARFDEKNSVLTSVQLFAGRISALLNPVTYALINLAIIWLIHFGALRVDGGALTQGSVVALYNYMSQILVELIKLANLIIQITRALACGKRIQSVLETESSMHSPDELPALDKNAPVVELRDASLRYGSAGGEALSGITLTARRGETVGIIGGTGAGKTSLISLIPRFYDVCGGEVLVEGADVRSWPLDELRQRVAVVPQHASLFCGTIRDNMLMGREDATDDDIMRALETAQATDVVAAKPEGLDYVIEQGAHNLSGGQRQRLTIARALLHGGDVLILDDSASALDFATDARLRRAVRSIEGMTVFIVSQRAASVMGADKIAVLDDGRIVGLGTHDELLGSCDVYREICQSQFKQEEAEAVK